MRVIAVACVEDRSLVDEQIAKQTRQPDEVVVLVDTEPAQGIDARRKRIAENQKLLQGIVERSDADIVWQLEGDSVVQENALDKLLMRYTEEPAVYSGVQVGRHGLYCLGAWHINADRTRLRSVDHRLHGLQEVQGMGLYCFVMDRQSYLAAYATWDGERWGPDVNFFLSSPIKKYVDMDLHVGHFYKGGIIRPTDAAVCNAEFLLVNNQWEFKQL